MSNEGIAEVCPEGHYWAWHNSKPVGVKTCMTCRAIDSEALTEEIKAIRADERAKIRAFAEDLRIIKAEKNDLDFGYNVAINDLLDFLDSLDSPSKEQTGISQAEMHKILQEMAEGKRPLIRRDSPSKGESK